MTDITERLRSIYVSEGANYVQEAADLIECLRAERKSMVNDVHSCGPTCTKAGCVNVRLREALQGLLDDITEYQTINHLGGENNHWQVAARAALGDTK
jgi:hypothetical protein